MTTGWRGVIAAWLLMAGCGGAPPGKNAIGAAGGSVTLTDGSGVTIPAGALASDVNIQVAPTANPKPPAASMPAGTAYTFGPEGTQFQSPVTITLALSGAVDPKNVLVFTAPAGTSNFTMLTPATLDATHVQVQVSHFSDFYPAWINCMDSMCAAGTKCCSCGPDYATVSCVAPSTCCK